MRNATETEIYLKKIKQHLLCSKALKKVFLDGLRQEIEASPGGLEMNMQTLFATFGTPEKVASEFLLDLDEEDHVTYTNSCRKKKAIAAALISIVILIVAAYLVNFYSKLTTTQPTMVIDTVTQSGPREITDEEFQKRLEKEN